MASGKRIKKSRAKAEPLETTYKFEMLLLIRTGFLKQHWIGKVTSISRMLFSFMQLHYSVSVNAPQGPCTVKAYFIIPHYLNTLLPILTTCAFISADVARSISPPCTQLQYHQATQLFEEDIHWGNLFPIKPLHT